MTNERDHDPSATLCAELKAAFRVLQSSHAIELLSCLTEGPSNVQTLAERLDIDQSAVSKTLGKLLSVDLLSMRFEGRNHIYRLSGAVKYTVSKGVIKLKMDYPNGASFSCSLPLIPGSHEYEVRIAKIKLDSTRSLLPNDTDQPPA